MKSNSKKEKNCINCNNIFLYYPSEKNKKFCSKKCYHSYPKPKGKDSKKYSKIEIKCHHCNKLYDEFPNKIKRFKLHFCTKDCYNKYQTNKEKNNTKFIIKNCAICNNEIRRTEAHFKNRPAKNYYCSTKCKDINLKKNRGGFSPFTKKCFYCNNDFTIESKNKRTVKYCSRECMKLGFPKGENHNNFKKELSRDYRSKHRLFPEVQIWRKTIFKRDQYTCQICNKIGDRLNAHHFENYSSNKDKRFNIDNGITLCIKCHKSFHSEYGVVRNNKLQFEEFKKG
jgi:endogenous inhibitor of DNA gyrase (YacG/DUF329 family)